MERKEFIDNKFINGWYKYAALRPGFVGYALQIIRERTDISSEDQQKEFGLDEKMFIRLQGMPSPRPKSIAKDAARIAEACNITNPFAFISAMLLAYKIEQSNKHIEINEFYQAAFDEEDDLDKFPEEG